ncbi:hypothetical protein [Corynebacterium glucuronolyticum]|uniref:Uncharacterized protein n=3 Tax=Corynebacterium glucuronolyticum TaxID=39791 RepID=A0AAX1L6C4_9CORY|nr:hypothetical protein [Corynebacterium glucuronolyticum]QRP70018.1 hypothetical protein I6J21_09530 [Corynebacterium glucuronolyticum]WKD64227.1 hypothetical protein CGLUCO_09945 [Corynebacterium glucuronolyticum DSM 44120]SMB84545.1 hypothetical protein SAMN05660745_01199 [Corynebacterium glucuronolyticum]
MRHSIEQFADTMSKLAVPIQRALTYGYDNAQEKNPITLRPDKKSLLSHLIRSDVFEYLRENPVDGFKLGEDVHRLNQSVCLWEESTGLEIRLAKVILTHVRTPIPQLDSDPSLQCEIPFSKSELETPGLAFVSWKVPDATSSYNFNLQAIRQSLNGNLRKGQADLVIPLNPDVDGLIPKTSFDPNAIYEYELEDEKDENFS